MRISNAKVNTTLLKLGTRAFESTLQVYIAVSVRNYRIMEKHSIKIIEQNIQYYVQFLTHTKKNMNLP